MRLLLVLSFTLGLAASGFADVLFEDFNAATFPPPGWTVIDNSGSGPWLLNTDYGRSNETGGDGTSAAIDGDKIGWGALDTELITPPFVVPVNAILEFDHSFRWYSGGTNEQGDVDISISDGSWVLLQNFSGGDDGYPGGAHKSIDLSSYAGFHVRIRFHYYDSNWDWWWQVDNVRVAGTTTFSADTYTLSESLGGAVRFSLTAGAGNAARDYIVFAGVSGTSPGFVLPGGLATLPLNWDGFTVMALRFINTSAFADFMGVLDGSGSASARLDTLGPLPPGAAGTVLYFAYAVKLPWDFASNPVAIEIVP